MISQILSAVLDKRPLLWVLPQFGEALWVLGWAMLGGLLAWRCQRLIYLLPAGIATIGILYGLCFGLLLIQGCWVPLVPSALALGGTGGTVVSYRTFENRKKQ
jgi:CHASE2 domain-containing sensor protein